eukprot:191117_1
MDTGCSSFEWTGNRVWHLRFVLFGNQGLPVVRGLRDSIAQDVLQGKLKRVALQFTPVDWTIVRWNKTASIKRLFLVQFMVFAFTLCELNGFFLKQLLWIPVEHPLNTYRCHLVMFVSMSALRQMYLFIVDPLCTSLGTQAWVCAVAASTELLLVIKFWDFPPIPEYNIRLWKTGAIVYVAVLLVVVLMIQRRQNQKMSDRMGLKDEHAKLK